MRVLHAGDDAEIREYMTGNICRIDHTSEINGYDRVKYAPARDISEHAVPASARVATSYPWVSSTFSERQALYLLARCSSSCPYRSWIGGTISETRSTRYATHQFA